MFILRQRHADTVVVQYCVAIAIAYQTTNHSSSGNTAITATAGNLRRLRETDNTAHILNTRNGSAVVVTVRYCRIKDIADYSTDTVCGGAERAALVNADVLNAVKAGRSRTDIAEQTRMVAAGSHMQILDGHTIAVETAAEGWIDIIDIITDRLEAFDTLEVEHRICLSNLKVRIISPCHVGFDDQTQRHHIAYIIY